jgi:hypothetical protein
MSKTRESVQLAKNESKPPFAAQGTYTNGGARWSIKKRT